MKDKSYWIRFANKSLIVSGVLAIICAIVVRWRTPTYTQVKIMTSRQFYDYRHAMNQYHDRYGRFPIHCTNVTELARALDGEDINGDNPDKVKCFPQEMALKKRVHDGWGFPIELSADASGTNFILRSYGKGKFREHRLTNSMAIVHCNISTLYALLRAEDEARAQAQPHPFTNSPAITRKETNHVNSVSQ